MRRADSINRRADLILQGLSHNSVKFYLFVRDEPRKVRIDSAGGETAFGGDLFGSASRLKHLPREQDSATRFFLGFCLFQRARLNWADVHVNRGTGAQGLLATRGELDGRILAADLFQIALVEQLDQQRFKIAAAKSCELP